MVLAALAAVEATPAPPMTLAQATQPPLVAVQPGAEPRCPSAVEVEAALLARVPGVVVAFERAAERRALLLLLAIGADTGVVDLTLVDAEGRVRLRRSLAGADEKKDCGALAETAALIVERYLVELDERAISIARTTAAATAAANTPLILRFNPEPSPWTMAVGTRARVGAPAWALLDFGLRVARTFEWPVPLLAHVRFGIGPSFQPFATGQDGYTGSAVVRRWPLELGLGWRRSTARFELQAGGGGALDFTYVHALGAGGTELTRWMTAPQLFGEIAAQRAVTQRVYLRLGALTTLNLHQYDFRAPERPTTGPLFSLPTQRIQVRLSLDVGTAL
jgi:hypothetical protein